MRLNVQAIRGCASVGGRARATGAISRCRPAEAVDHVRCRPLSLSAARNPPPHLSSLPFPLSPPNLYILARRRAAACNGPEL